MVSMTIQERVIRERGRPGRIDAFLLIEAGEERQTIFLGSISTAIQNNDPETYAAWVKLWRGSLENFAKKFGQPLIPIADTN